MPTEHRRWIRIRPTLIDRELILEYRDSRGRVAEYPLPVVSDDGRQVPAHGWIRLSLGHDGSARAVLVAQSAWSTARELLDGAPPTEVIPLFLASVPPPLETAELELIVTAALKVGGLDPMRFAIAAETASATPRRRGRLTIGAPPWAIPALRDAASRALGYPSQGLQEQYLRIEPLEPGDSYDMVVGGYSPRSLGAEPFLAVVPEGMMNTRFDLAGLGTSFVVVPGGEEAALGFAADTLTRLLQDADLPQAVLDVTSASGIARQNVRLITSPGALGSDMFSRVALQASAHLEESRREDAGPDERRVGLWLARAEDDRPIDAGTVLARDAVYRLTVEIGSDRPDNLVVGSPPPFAPLLPNPDDPITVTVFSDTATVLEQRAQVIGLSADGGTSSSATFLMRMPETGDRSRIRVLLHVRGNLVQAFRLYADLAGEEFRQEGRHLEADLQYSRASLDDLSEISPRALSIAANADTRGGTHRLMFANGEEVSLSSDTVKKADDYFRAFLGNSLARQLEDNDLDELKDALKGLARSGNALWWHLYGMLSQQGKPSLDHVQATELQTVQIVRLATEFTFPWAALYDWALPDTVEEIDAAPFCLGTPGTCACARDKPGFCAKGFWAVRHVIEEQFGEGMDLAHARVTSGGASPAVISTVGSPDLVTADMETDLARALSAVYDTFESPESLYARLWDPDKRPAVVVALGHVEIEEEVADQSPNPRMFIDADERYLTFQKVLQSQRDRGSSAWANPHRPIVFLLGCSTTARLGELSDLVSAFTSCGASAIVSTQQSITSALGASVAVSVVPRLSATPLGEALRAWRADRFANADPMGLAFTCYGSSEVTVAEVAVPK